MALVASQAQPTASTADASSAHMPQLDALRALAVVAVAYSHWVPRQYQLGVHWGDVGVQLFFVLSGFLISSILLRCRQSENPWFSLRAFYARRFLRIFPLYYVVLLAAFAFSVEGVREAFLWHAAYLSNVYFLVHQAWSGPTSHFWSLAVEEQFYLFWPAVLLFVPRRAIASSIVLLIAAGVISRSLLHALFPHTLMLDELLISNFDALGLGAFLALTRGRADKPGRLAAYSRIGLPVFAIFVVLGAAGIAMPLHDQLARISMLLGFVWLIDGAARGFGGAVGRLLGLPVLLYLGRISYGLYMLHNFVYLPVTYICNTLGYPSLLFGMSGVALKAFATFLGATLSWHLLESPLNSIKDRFPYGPSARLTRQRGDAEALLGPAVAGR